ncbi:MAG: hypothetical protein AAFP77_28695 [Bacteroidota bacterium]
MEFFSINIATVIIRFFLMMAVIIIGVFSGQWWLTVLGLPIFLSVMLGISFKRKQVQAAAGVSRTITQNASAA